MKYISTSKCRKSGRHGAAAKVVYDPLTGRGGVRCPECFAVLPGFTTKVERGLDGSITVRATRLKDGSERQVDFPKDAVDAYLRAVRNNEPSLDGGQTEPV